MKTINQQLEELYETEIRKLKETDFEGQAGPLLMADRTKAYSSLSNRVLYVGQESNGWTDGVQDVRSLMQDYLSKGKGSTTFWQYIYRIHNELNPEFANEFEFFWTNVSKFSSYEGKPISDNKFYDILTRFDVLKDEISIIEPNVVVFFSGWRYDDWLSKQFNDEVEFLPVEGNSEKELVLLSHPTLPKLTFRTYHPNYLQQNGLDSCSEILKSIKRFNLSGNLF